MVVRIWPLQLKICVWPYIVIFSKLYIKFTYKPFLFQNNRGFFVRGSLFKPVETGVLQTGLPLTDFIANIIRCHIFPFEMGI